jgi:hypothetical protein
MSSAQPNLQERSIFASRRASPAPDGWEFRLDDWLLNHAGLLGALILTVGFGVRLWAATGTFLNPDEVLHFRAANQPSWNLSYQSGLAIAHPPLLIFLLHVWRLVGTSELLLRFPSIVLGTAFCWSAFRWLMTLFGRRVALIGATFAAFLPPMIALSAEVRQYALLLFFSATAANLLELALQHGSVRKLWLCIVCVYAALFSHYSAVLFAAALGMYGLLRLLTKLSSRGMLFTWIAGQIGALAVCGLLYFVQLSKLRANFGGISPLHDFMGNYYLHNSYFLGRNPILFVIARTGGVFQYVFGQLVIGDLAFPIFIAGIVLLLRSKAAIATADGSPRLIAILLLLPFVLNCALALAEVYPYGGTRHSAFLFMFAMAGVSLFLAKAVGNRAARGISFALLIAILCNAFATHHKPYIARADQHSENMNRALEFIETQVAPDAPIFADQQTILLLGHYLCHQKPYVLDRSLPNFTTVQCERHKIIAPRPDNWIFDADTFLLRWSDMVRTFHPAVGQTILVVQAGWDIALARQLQSRDEFRNVNFQLLGRNVTLFKLRVGKDGGMDTTQTPL